MITARKRIIGLTFTLSCLVCIGLWGISLPSADAQVYKVVPEIRPEITTGGYQTDTTRMVDAYERLTDQYLTLVQSNLTDMKGNSRQTLVKLDSIERKLDSLNSRIGRIEKALNIEQPPIRTRTTSRREAATGRGAQAQPESNTNR